MIIKILISALCLIMCIYLTIKTTINKINKDIKRTDEIIEIIEQLRQESIKNFETLEQEPKRGEWLDAREDTCWHICSECKRIVDDDSNYCPNCGADMRGEE